MHKYVNEARERHSSSMYVCVCVCAALEQIVGWGPSSARAAKTGSVTATVKFTDAVTGETRKWTVPIRFQADSL
jgi:hypothetical protein